MCKCLFCSMIVAAIGLGLSVSAHGSQNYFYLIDDLEDVHENGRYLLVSEDSNKALSYTKGQKSLWASDVTVSSDGASVFSYSQDAILLPYRSAGVRYLQFIDFTEVSAKGDVLLPAEDGITFIFTFENGYAMLKESNGSRYVIYDAATSSFKLGDKSNARLRLYLEDAYSLEIGIDGNRVSFSNNETLWSDEYFHLTYLINDGENVTLEGLKASGHVIETRNGVPDIVVEEDGSTIWAVLERWYHSIYDSKERVRYTRSPLFRGSLVGERLSEGFGHDSDMAYQIGQSISFIRNSGVRILYTLDGTDPIKEEVASAPARAASESHDGVVYDLDDSPLTFEGNEMTVTYRALKAGYRPSEPVVFTVGQSGGVVTSVRMLIDDVDEVPVYYNLYGVQVENPMTPGVYVRVAGNKTDKVFVR